MLKDKAKGNKQQRIEKEKILLNSQAQMHFSFMLNLVNYDNR